MSRSYSLTNPHPDHYPRVTGTSIGGRRKGTRIRCSCGWDAKVCNDSPSSAYGRRETRYAYDRHIEDVTREAKAADAPNGTPAPTHEELLARIDLWAAATDRVLAAVTAEQARIRDAKALVAAARALYLSMCRRTTTGAPAVEWDALPEPIRVAWGARAAATIAAYQIGTSDAEH